jgi:hypothetical protein
MAARDRIPTLRLLAEINRGASMGVQVSLEERREENRALREEARQAVLKAQQLREQALANRRAAEALRRPVLLPGHVHAPDAAG